jgi:hypothetical protein
VKDLYKENDKSLKKEMKEDYRRWKDLPSSWIGRIINGENGYITKSHLHVQCNSHQNFNEIHTDIEKSTLKFIWKQKRLQIGKTILSKKSNARGITISDLKLYYRTIAIKITWYWQQKQVWR